MSADGNTGEKAGTPSLRDDVGGRVVALVFAGVLGVLALIGLAAQFAPSSGWCGEATRAEAYFGSCTDFWLNRYQTLLTGIIAIGAAVLAWRLGSRSQELTRQQNAVLLFEHLARRRSQLQKTLNALRDALRFAVSTEMGFGEQLTSDMSDDPFADGVNWSYARRLVQIGRDTDAVRATADAIRQSLRALLDEGLMTDVVAEAIAKAITFISRIEMKLLILPSAVEASNAATTQDSYETLSAILTNHGLALSAVAREFVIWLRSAGGLPAVAAQFVSASRLMEETATQIEGRSP